MSERARSTRPKGKGRGRSRKTAAPPALAAPPAAAPVSARRVPRFAGVATFLRLPQQEAPAGLDALVCGAPFDGGTTFRPGARFGPRAVREASALTRGYHPVHALDLFETLRCADGGDILCVPMSIEHSLANIRARVEEILRAGTLPVLVGGDHTITLGALRAVAAVRGPVGLVHFDAHSDAFPPAWDVDVHHGTVFRNAVEEGLLRARDVVQIGIRGPWTAGRDLDVARKAGFRIVTVDDVREDRARVERSLAQLGGRLPFYVTVDVDVLDPAYAPGTGTPVPGGLTTWELLRLLRALVGVDIVGCDVVEVSPDHDRSGNTALVAATVVTELLAAVAAGRKRR